MCSIGTNNGGACAEESDGRYKSKEDFSGDEWSLLKIRTGSKKLRTVCCNHEKDYLIFYERRFKYCCNPLELHATSRKGDRVISLEMYKKSRILNEFSDHPLVPGQKLCPNCSVSLSKMLKNVEEVEDQASSASGSCESSQNLSSEPFRSSEEQEGADSTPSCSQDANNQSFATPPDMALQQLNLTLDAMKESPINKRKLSLQPTYRESKVKKIEEKLGSLVSKVSGEPFSSTNNKAVSFDIMIEQLKARFEHATNSERVLILSVLPGNWTREQVMAEFGPVGATMYMVRKTKDLVKEKGVLVSSVRKPGKKLSDATVKIVQDFYEDDECSSRLMPGKKDFVSVKVNGQKVHKQKRLVLSNLMELYQLFKEKFPTFDIGFSKFAELRPKHCVLAGSAGTHSVCVCTYHQNFKLMLEGAQLHVATKDDASPLKSYKDCISLVLCDTPTQACHLDACCPQCPGIEVIRERLQQVFSDEFTDYVEYKMWTTVDRCSLITIKQSSDDFIESFVTGLVKLLPHDFIAKEQAKYLNNLKLELKEEEAIVICDFAENYSTITQESIQTDYWNKTQVTICPFVAYIKVNDELKPVCFSIISDYMKHNVQAVYTFQKKFISFLHKDFPQVKKVIYFSDGAASQFKNKTNIANCCAHGEDMHGIEAEWHYFATSHGKGPCDGVGGTLKRLAARASLQNASIQSAEDFYNWAKGKIKNIHTEFVSEQDVQELEPFLQERFSKVQAIPGMRSIHACIPKSSNKVLIRRFSSMERGDLVSVNPVLDQPHFSNLKVESFITILYRKKWCLAQIINMDDETEELLVELFHPPGNAKHYTTKSEEISIQTNEILTIVHPTWLDNKIELSLAEKAEARLQLQLLQSS